MDAVWEGLMDTVFYDSREAWLQTPCKVTFHGERLVISFDLGDGNYRYSGKEIGEGHFDLSLEEGEGRGTLHRFATSRILEGYWTEGSAHGFWRISRPVKMNVAY